MTTLLEWLRSVQAIESGRPLIYNPRIDVLRFTGDRPCWCRLRRDIVVHNASYRFQVLSITKTARLRSCRPIELLYSAEQDWPRFIYWSDEDVLQFVGRRQRISYHGTRGMFQVQIKTR